MTPKEMDAAHFSCDSKVIYHGKEYYVYSVDFTEHLIAIDEFGTDGEMWNWKRCENCTLI